MAQVSTAKILNKIADLENEAADLAERARTSRDPRDGGHAEYDAAMCRNFAVNVLKSLLEESE
jgi:hypothetical protein